MFGFSIFLNEEISQNTKNYIEKMTNHGFKGIFTSLHIPEDNATCYKSRLVELGKISKQFKLDLMVDISGEALKQAGFSFDNLIEIKEIGITGFRIDDCISNQLIAKLSHQIHIALNASTITAKDMDELVDYRANFENLEAWHNYYPRPNTALDQTWFDEKNTWLKKFGFKIEAFIPGDKNLRAPLYQGLPTLEAHRYMNPFSAALDLVGKIDKIYIGDGGLLVNCLKQFACYKEKEMICLTAEIYDSNMAFVLGEHTNRQDEARDVIRSLESRFNKTADIMPALPAKNRKIGTITIDNINYLRYQGEIQIIKNQLPANEKVNIIGRVIEKDRDLLRHIKGGQKFRIESVTCHD